jgi:hypothetical protein
MNEAIDVWLSAWVMAWSVSDAYRSGQVRMSGERKWHFTGNYTCNSFKSGLIDGDFDFDTDTFKIALYTNSASLNAETDAYTASGEVVWFRLHGWWEYPNRLPRASQVAQHLSLLQILRGLPPLRLVVR